MKKKKDEIRKTLMEKIEGELSLRYQENTWEDKKLNYKEGKEHVLSLFSGAGGLDLGVELAGLDVLYGKEEVNKAFENPNLYNQIRDESLFAHLYTNDIFTEALETYKNNFSQDTLIHQEDIRKIKHFPQAEVVLGGFPCPGFSEAGPRLIDDPRNFLYIHYIRCLIDIQPKVFIAENVRGMLTLGGGEVFKQIVEDFEAAGYRLYYQLVDARDYGIPQIRKRVFLIGVREDLDFEYEFPEKTHGAELIPYVTLEEAIGDLQTDPGEYFTGGYSSMYMSRNRKKKWSDQSFTIQASGRQAPLHPSGEQMKHVGKDKWEFPSGEKNSRRLSVKEIKRIQTFPDWFVFSQGETEKISTNGRLNKVYKQIGNAVPVELGRIIATPIAKWLKDEKKDK